MSQRDVDSDSGNMAQEKEVQNMLMQEKYDQMDWQSYGDAREEEGMEKGLKEGLKEGTVLSILKALNKGISVETIASLFDLQIGTVQKAEKLIIKYSDQLTVQKIWEKASAQEKNALLQEV